MKKIVLSSLVGLMAVSSMGVGSVTAQESLTGNTKATVEFTTNTTGLEFVSASQSIDFGEIEFTYEGINQTGVIVDENEEADFQIVVNDERNGNTHKWSLTADVSSGAEQGLPEGSLITFNGGSVASNYELTGVDPTVVPNLALKVGDEGVSVLNAVRTEEVQQGIGAWTLTYPAANIELKMGSEQMAAISAAEGTYSTTITWSLTDGL